MTLTKERLTRLPIGLVFLAFLSCMLLACAAEEMVNLDRTGKGPGLAYVVQGANQVRFVNFADYSDSLLAGSPAGLVGPASETPVKGSVARFRNPSGLVATADGTLYVADTDNYLVRRIANDADATVSTLAIVDVDGKEVVLNRPAGLLLEGDRHLYITDAAGRSVKKVRLDPEHGVLELEIPLVASGHLPPGNRIGIPREHMEGGIGSTMIIPVLADLEPGLEIRSLQYYAELSPITDIHGRRPPPITNKFGFSAINHWTNNLILFGVTFSSQSSTALWSSATFGDTNQVTLAFLGPSANLLLRGSNLVNWLSVSIPRTAMEGDQYRVSMKKVSGTLDANQWTIPLAAMPDTIIEVRNHSYVVGDVAPSASYNAEGLSQGPGSLTGFGDGKLDNADVNSVLQASLGIRVPPVLSDVLNAMDAWPLDEDGFAGGDGTIRFLDWQTLLVRSLGFDPHVWSRVRNNDGRIVATLVAGPAPTRSSERVAAKGETPNPNLAWNRDVMIGSDRVVLPSAYWPFEIPVFVNIRSGRTVRGLMFKAEIKGLPDGVPPISFMPRPELPSGRILSTADGLPSNQIAAAWSTLDGLMLAEGKQYLGKIVIESDPKLRQYLSENKKLIVTFPVFDAVPDAETPYDVDRRTEYLAIQSPSLPLEVAFSDEWATNFFKPLGLSPLPNGDSDLDGVSDADEFAAGTNPVDLYLKVTPGPDSSVSLEWLAPRSGAGGGLLETSTNLNEGWGPVTDNTPYQLEYYPQSHYLVRQPLTGGSQFFRLRRP